MTPLLATTGKAANGNTIYDGVEVNPNGMIEAYHPQHLPPRARHGVDQVDARQGIRRPHRPPEHLAGHGLGRPDQYRGVSYLAQVIEPLLQLRRYTESELTAAIVESFSPPS